MRHAKPYRKLGRQRSHYRAMMRNMAFSLFQHERIETTLPKAKEVRRFVEKIISLGKRGDLHARRRAMALMGNKVVHESSGRSDVIGKVFSELSERYKTRPGGYTRIIRLATARPGDAASMAILELVDAPEKTASNKNSKSKKEEAKSAEA